MNTLIPQWHIVRRLHEPEIAAAMAKGQTDLPWIFADRQGDEVRLMVFDRASHFGMDAVEEAFAKPTPAKSCSMTILSCPGGSTSAGMRLNTCLKRIGREGCFVRVIEQASSCAIDWLCLSGRTVAREESRFMIHCGSVDCSEAQFLELQPAILSKIFEETHVEALETLKLRIRDPINFLTGAEHWLGGREAKEEFGLIDSLEYP